MTKQQLAQQLRERQIALGYVAPQIVNSLSDNDVVDCYNKCSQCGEKFIGNNKLLIKIIGWSKDAGDFIERLAKHQH